MSLIKVGGKIIKIDGKLMKIATASSGGSQGGGGSSSIDVAKVKSVNTLYDIGETSLTTDDIVTVNGVECYVLSRTDTTAQLITKNIYDQRFNISSGGDVAEYTYSLSNLKAYMDNFYTDQLGSDSRIIDHIVTSYTYTKDVDSGDLTPLATSTITQKVYALDAVEARTNESQFGSYNWDSYNAYRDSAYTDDCYGFWVTAGFGYSADSYAFTVTYDGVAEFAVCSTYGGARPCFTITLE